jgi:FMN reductase
MPHEGHAVVVGLGGSLRRPSRSLSALEVAGQAAEAVGAEVRLFDLRVLDLPLFVPRAAPTPAALEYADAVYEADGLIWSSPMYHGTISGAFKNALDWLELLGQRDPPYLTDKIVGLISSASGVQGLQAAVPLVVPIASRDAFDAEGKLADERVVNQLRHLGEEVAEICLGRRPR